MYFISIFVLLLYVCIYVQPAHVLQKKLSEITKFNIQIMTFITAISYKFSILVQITNHKHFNYGLSTHEEQLTAQSPNKPAFGCTVQVWSST